MISPLTIALLAAGCCMAFAENSVFYRETPLACRIKCNAFFRAENSFFYTDCDWPEFDNKCVHMPQPWLVGFIFLVGIAIPALIICCVAQLCFSCINACFA